LLSQLPKLTSDNSNDVFFRADDPVLLEYDRFREQFGRDEMVIAAVRPPEVFDAAFLSKLKEFHTALEEEVPYLREVTSLVNVRDTRGEKDELIVEDLLKEIPQNAKALAELEERVMSSRLYPNYLISEDGKTTTIFMETLAFSPGEAGDELTAGFKEEAEQPQGAESRPSSQTTPLNEKENSELIQAVEKVAAKFAGADFPVRISGSPVMVDYFNKAIGRDVGTFMSLAFVAFTIFLLILFRRFSGALLPLMVVMLSMLSTIALLAIFGRPFTSVTSILPSFMMSVGVGSSVHVLAIFYRRFRETEDKEDAITFTFHHSGLPIFMTSLTTAAGLLSFATANIPPVADLGVFGGMGVMVILVFTMIMMPALIALLPLRPKARFAGQAYGKGMDRILTGIANFATTRAWAVVVVSAVIVIVAGFGLTRQGFGHSMFKWLPHGSDVRDGIELLDREMKGAFSIELVADLGRENGLYEPEVMNNLLAIGQYAEEFRNEEGVKLVGKTTSIVDVLRETHKALNENDPEFYRIPQDRKLIAQELLLFENSGSDDLEKLVDTNFSKARITARVLVQDASKYRSFVDALDGEAKRLMGEKGEVEVTGAVRLFTETIGLMMQSVARSYVIAGVVITVMMILMLGSYRIGLLSMIPNLAPIVITLGVMGWLDIKMDMSNMLLGTVAIGLAVDDTIHFFHNFRSYYTRSQNAAEATRETMLSTGRAILFTTLVLVTGFWLFMFASLINLIHFGFLIGVTLIIALLADVLLAPAMMELITRTERGRAILARWGTRQTLA
jgi:predicted RND superfamily exporter protein